MMRQTGLDLDHEALAISGFCSYLKDVLEFELGEERLAPVFMELQELLGKRLKLTPPQAVVVALYMGAQMALSAADPEMVAFWAKVQSDWRVSSCMALFSELLLAFRDTQAQHGTLPIDLLALSRGGPEHGEAH